MRFCRLFCLTLFLSVLPLAAAESVLTLDPALSRVVFTLGAHTHTVHGTLELSEGRIRFDPKAGTASGRIVFHAPATDTGKKSRDKKMHEKVLESAIYPKIVFTPASFQGVLPESGSAHVTLVGSVSIHGGEHSVALDATIDRAGNRVKASFALDIPFVEWGMKDPSFLVFRVEKIVKVAADIEGLLE